MDPEALQEGLKKCSSCMKGALKFLYKSSRTSHALKVYMKYNIIFFVEHKTEKMQKVVQKKKKKI